ncbi:MAG: SocA family protein [Odoribacter sp.]|nr:SocA family protein [Odoribacter sp.]
MKDIGIIKLFDKDVAMNAVLYILEKYGGKSDMHKVFKTLYFADREHLARYGRSITRDVYVAMKYGPVPSRLDDIFRAVRGDSYFSFAAKDFTRYMSFVNRFTINAETPCDMRYLSETDKECLNIAIEKCRDLNFNQLTSLSHDFAWNAANGGEISVADMMREIGEEEGYALYVENQIKDAAALL